MVTVLKKIADESAECFPVWRVGRLIRRPPLPVALSRSLGSLGGMALPLALLSIRAGLTLRNIRDGLGAASWPRPSMLRSCRWRAASLPDGVSHPEETLLTLIFLACPTASSAYIYARQLHGDPGISPAM